MNWNKRVLYFGINQDETNFYYVETYKAGNFICYCWKMIFENMNFGKTKKDFNLASTFNLTRSIEEEDPMQSKRIIASREIAFISIKT